MAPFIFVAWKGFTQTLFKNMDPDIAVRVEHLSKRYRFGLREEKPDSLLGVIANLATKPVDNLRRIRRLTSFSDDDAAKDVLWAVDDVSFEVRKGEVLGIIGRNGAGKSTLLKLLAKITEPTKGMAYVNGKVASLLEVGTGFHPELTGRENVNLNGAILGMTGTEISEQFSNIVEFAGLAEYIDTPVKRYSTGMVVRLGFAVAAHLTPEIMLVDEVLAVGDAEFQKKCLGKMDDFASSGRTVLFVSHNMSSVNRLCTRVVLLEQGKIVADGPAPEVTSRYLMGTESNSGARTWTEDDAPGAGDLSLTSITLTNSAGTPSSTINITEPVELSVGYLVKTPHLRFRCTVEFWTQGVMAFYSVESTETERKRIGEYYSRLRIPGNLFAEGDYTVRISIFTSAGSKHHYAQMDDAFVFQVYDPMDGTSARGDYAQNHPGVVRPQLDWRITFGEDESTLLNDWNTPQERITN